MGNLAEDTRLGLVRYFLGGGASKENFFFKVGFGILLFDVGGAERCLRRRVFETLLEVFA